MKTLRQIIRWVLFLASVAAAIFYLLFFLSRLTSIDIVIPFLIQVDRTPIGLSPFFAAYFSIGLSYFLLFELIDGEEYEFDSIWQRLLTVLLIVYWPLGLVGEILAAYSIVTSESALKRFLNFFFESIFFRLLYICSFGVAVLWLLNAYWPA